MPENVDYEQDNVKLIHGSHIFDFANGKGITRSNALLIKNKIDLLLLIFASADQKFQWHLY